MKTFRRIVALGIAGLSLSFIASVANADINPLAKDEQKVNVYVTLYGSPDNDPPGTGNIAFPVIHQKAGGTGTYADPVTFAVKIGYLPVGQIIYYPRLRKYFIMEDECASCKAKHVDLWAGYGSKRGGILKCEDKLTRSSDQIIISPAATYAVDTTPIWDENTKTCQKAYNS